MEQMDNALRQLFCPLCNSADVYLAGRLKYSFPVQFSSHVICLSRIPELWKCNACYSWYSNNVLPENIAADLYARGVSADRWSQDPVEAGKSKEIINMLTDAFVKGKKVLDIGCNTGAVLDLATTRGCITAGIEFSTACHDQLRNKGHKYFSDLKKVDGQYDV
ncbi:MAG: class I SAM-dependent methyltransferase, partial [Gammaproteobacteria bacterium]